MNTIYFTIAGTNHWHGSEFLKEGMRVVYANLNLGHMAH